MPVRKKPTLLVQGKPRSLGGSARPWRVRLYAPEDGGTKYQVMYRAPAGEGEPWKRMLRRASSEAEARKIFAQAEAALDAEKETPAGADVRAARTIRMLGEKYLKDSTGREDLRGPMADAADKLCGPDGTDPLLTRLPSFGTKIRAAGFRRATPRRAERPARDRRLLRPRLRPRQRHVDHAARSGGLRGPVKNHTLHEVPLPMSLMHDELLPRVKELLGLPAKTSAGRQRSRGRTSAPGVTSGSREGQEPRLVELPHAGARRTVALRRHRDQASP